MMASPTKVKTHFMKWYAWEMHVANKIQDLFFGIYKI